MVIVDLSATILRGVSALISLVVSIFMPSKSIECLLAAIPMIVAIQVAKAVATRSVGEKDSPFPSLSTGASVSSLASEGPWTAEQCNCPSYLTEIFTKAWLALPCARTACPSPSHAQKKHNSRSGGGAE